MDTKTAADHVLVAAAATTELRTLRLQKLETAIIKINVIFEDGTRPEWSNLLFHNSSFPYDGFMGGTAPGVTDGKGEFTLPMGFEYYACAKVDCDAGARIETRESRPIQIIRAERGSTPTELTFVIAGPPCHLWTPRE